MFHSTAKRTQRRAWPIHAYVGPNGGGKSACAVWDSMPTLSSGRPVLSTVRLLDFDNPRDCEGCEQLEYHTDPDKTHRQAHPLWIPFVEWKQLLHLERADVIMDEVTGVASSRESAGLPAPVANLLVQLRRRDVVLRWTAPSWARADKIIRECTQGVTHCQGHMAREVIDQEQDRAWRHRRFLHWRTYDAMDFDEFTEGKREDLRPQTNNWFWLPSSTVVDAYDTFDAVTSIGTVTDAGRCYNCGGRRQMQKCECGESHADTGRTAVGQSSGRRSETTDNVQPGRRRRIALAG